LGQQKEEDEKGQSLARKQIKTKGGNCFFGWGWKNIEKENIEGLPLDGDGGLSIGLKRSQGKGIPGISDVARFKTKRSSNYFIGCRLKFIEGK